MLVRNSSFLEFSYRIHSKDHQQLDWKTHKISCGKSAILPPSGAISPKEGSPSFVPNSGVTSTSIQIPTPEGYSLTLCARHRLENCSICSLNFLHTNAINRYQRLLYHSQQLVCQEELLQKQLTSCSNPNCPSKWPATEEFSPPIIDISQLQRCQKCYHACYCSNSCQKEHYQEHQMICKLYTPMYTSTGTGVDYPVVQYAYCLGTILEEIYESIPTGLCMKIIFFNGEIDLSSPLHLYPYYILEYMPSEPLLIPTNSIFDDQPFDSDTSVTTWKRCTQSTLERYVNSHPTGTYVEILSTTQSNNEECISAIPWLNGHHLSDENVEFSKRYVVVECRTVHDETHWRKRKV